MTVPAAPDLRRLAPGGSPISLGALARVFAGGDAERELGSRLCRLLSVEAVTLHASGREAMRAALAHLAQRTARREVVVPAYICFSVPAAAVAAGLRVRLVDLDESGRLEPQALERLPLDDAAALVVGNLFGVPESLGETLPLARSAGVAVIDDAAQALGAFSRDCAVGGRGDVGVLSFGRGKPLSALGGGALAWPSGSLGRPDALPVSARPLAGAIRGLAYDVARWPLLLGVLSRIPALGIGETVYDPDFERGAMPGAALSLARALMPDLVASSSARAEVARVLAEAIDADTAFRPLLATQGDVAVHPRLGILAPSPEARDAALAGLRSLGATAMYPSTLARLKSLQPHLVGATLCPGAEAFASRLLTLPTHAGATAKLGAILAVLRA